MHLRAMNLNNNDTPSPPISVDASINLEEEPINCPFSCTLPKNSSSSDSDDNTSRSHLESDFSKKFLKDSRYSRDTKNFQTCPGFDSSRIGLSTHTSRSCLKTESESPTLKCVHIELTDRKDQQCQECVEELFSDTHRKNSDNLASEDRRAVDEFKMERQSKDSGGACSLADSAAGFSEGNTRATYYHSKLLSTLQILQNKEETIRVQAESLAVAEARIVALTERSAELRKDLERKTKELQALRKTLECCRAEKVDISITDLEDQSCIVSTLQNNLNVIEDLYRECFYETAKQEDLIDVLRKSYLDMRAMDRRKEDQIGRLHTVINTQKWSLDRCQDIALEVDNLKMEISNFLSSSTSTNNDSGMWERSEESFAFAPGVQEELHDVTEQLLGLQELLTADCSFDFEAENKSLKLENDALLRKISEISKANCEMELSLVEQKTREQRYQDEMKIKEQQLTSMRQELTELVQKSSEFEKLTTESRQAQVLLGEKSEELEQMRQQCATHQATISELRQERTTAERVCEENCKIRSEVSYLTAQVAQWRGQLAASEDRVRTLDVKLRQVQACYREKEASVCELQAQLERAHARGAALCHDARRALCSVHHWARRMRDRHRDQQNRIKAKDDLIAVLQQQLDERASSSGHCGNTSSNNPPCSKCSVPRQTSFCPRRSQYFASTESEMASCSSAPIPPKRHLKKNSLCGDVRCPAAPWLCDETTQQPIRHDRCVESRLECCAQRRDANQREVSPIDEVFARVEQLSEALADGYRRWTRPDPR